MQSVGLRYYISAGESLKGFSDPDSPRLAVAKTRDDTGDLRAAETRKTPPVPFCKAF